MGRAATGICAPGANTITFEFKIAGSQGATFPDPTPQVSDIGEILDHLPPIPTSPDHQRDLRSIGVWGRDLAERLA